MTPNRHSRQAYIIIKTIHLMNFTNADTLAPIMKMQRSDTARASGNCSFSFNRSKQLENSLENNSGLESRQQVGRSGWMLVGDRALL
jgi:hypothetical protein